MSLKKRPLFIDLDETLIFAHEPSPESASRLASSQRVLGYEAICRPQSHEILGHSRKGGREVFLFTTASFDFALAASLTFSLGFDDRHIFCLEMILNCRPGLSPQSILIDNKPAGTESSVLKMAALGIRSEQLWVIPSFEPPQFASAKLFALGLPLRLARHDRSVAANIERMRTGHEAMTRRALLLVD